VHINGLTKEWTHSTKLNNYIKSHNRNTYIYMRFTVLGNMLKTNKHD